MQNISKNFLQELSKLKQKKYRDIQERYIVSGLNAVQGALDCEGIHAQALLVRQGNEALLESISQIQNTTHYLLSEKDFLKLSDEKAPQGIALLMEKSRFDIRDFKPQSRIALYLEKINDPGNLGTIIRSALWFGVQTILLSPDSVDPFQPKVIRASAGYASQMHIYENVELAQLHHLLKRWDYQSIGTIIEGGSAPEQLKLSEKPKLLAFGSEAHGLSDELGALCSQMLTLPKKGKGESLNLAVSVALCLYGLTQ